MEKIVLIGAGSAMFTVGIASDLIRSGTPAELVLVDIDPNALRIAQRLCEKMVAAAKSPLKISAHLERRTALQGATAVIVTIGVGGRRAWDQDVQIARRHGIYMPVGDTSGPCGTSRALRMVPALVEIARDVLDLCPQALFFNYSNPMAVNCFAIRKATGAPVTGLCTGTWDTAKLLARALQTPVEKLDYSAAGINHLTWFHEVRIDGQDMFPALRAHAQEVLAKAREIVSSGTVASAASPFAPSLNFPFSWQCVLWFDAFPSPEDRHVTEFFPQFFRSGAYYGRTLGVDEFSFERTIAHGDQIFARMTADAESDEPLQAAYLEGHAGEQEQAVSILHAIRENRPMRCFANLPNQGQAPNLPLGSIVETPALAAGNGVRALAQPPLPVAAAGVLASRMAWVELTAEAALEKSREKFIQALILDGSVSTPDQAEQLADDLLSAQQAYLNW